MWYFETGYLWRWLNIWDEVRPGWGWPYTQRQVLIRHRRETGTQRRSHVETEAETGGRRPPAQGWMPGASSSWKRREGASPGDSGRSLALGHLDHECLVSLTKRRWIPVVWTNVTCLRSLFQQTMNFCWYQPPALHYSGRTSPQFPGMFSSVTMSHHVERSTSLSPLCHEATVLPGEAVWAPLSGFSNPTGSSHKGEKWAQVTPHRCPRPDAICEVSPRLSVFPREDPEPRICWGRNSPSTPPLVRISASQNLCCWHSVAQSCPTLCNPVDCSTPGFPDFQHLPELSQTHARRVGDAIPPSPPVSSPSPPAFNLSQHQGLFQWVSCSNQVAKGLELQLQILDTAKRLL